MKPSKTEQQERRRGQPAGVKAKTAPGPGQPEPMDEEALLDKALADTFPASDPVAVHRRH
jgi:hypothetical protein